MRIQNLFRRMFKTTAIERDLDDEIESYIAKDIEEKIVRGMKPEEARRQALMELGGTEQVKETMRNSRSLAWLDSMLADIRYACRTFVKRPSFTILAILTMALGIGAATSMFSVVDTVLLRPLPFKDSARLVTIWGAFPKLRNDPILSEVWNTLLVSYPQYQGLRQLKDIFNDVSVFEYHQSWLTGRGEPRSISIGKAPANLFSFLGVSSIKGRLLLAEDENPDSSRTAVISETLWRAEFGTDPHVLGQTVTFDRDEPPYTIVGVFPQSLQLATPGMDGSGGHKDSWRGPDVWVALKPSAPGFDSMNIDYEAIGKLKTGISIVQAEAAVQPVLDALLNPIFHRDWADREGVHIVYRHEQEGGGARVALFILFGAAGLLLIIACGNVANLLLGQSIAHRHETALRVALGATRLRIVRQFVTESVLLALFGGAIGSILASWAVRILIRVAPGELPRMNEIGVDFRVLLFTTAVCFLTGGLFGLVPILTVLRSNLNDPLKVGSRNLALQNGILPGLLMAGEIALSFVLLVAAGLLTQSLLRLNAVNPGLQPEHLWVVQLTLPDHHDQASGFSFFRQAALRLKSLPGITDVSETDGAPFSSLRNPDFIEIEGRPPLPRPDLPVIEKRGVLSNYFSVAGTAIVEGRTFTSEEVTAGASVAIVSKGMARRFWPDESAIGKRFRSWSPDGRAKWLSIVGVSNDVKFFGLDKEMPEMIYAPTSGPFTTHGRMTLLIRTSGDPQYLAPQIRNEIRAIAKDLPIERMETMHDLISESTATERYRAILINIFALVAGMLTLIGLYGVVSRFVAQRTHELGIRIALGAKPNNVLWFVLRQGLVLTTTGIGVGVVAAIAATRVLSGFLFGIGALDVSTYLTIALGLMFVALLAGYVPARRAVRTDSMIVLRAE